MVQHAALGTPPAAADTVPATKCQCRKGVKCATKGCPCRASGNWCGPTCGCSKECCENHAVVEVQQDHTIVLSPMSPGPSLGPSAYTAPSIFPSITSPSRTPTPPAAGWNRAIDPALLATAFRTVLVRVDDKPALTRMCSDWGVPASTSLGVSQLVDRLYRHATTQADLLRLSEDSLWVLSDAAGIHLPSAGVTSHQVAHKLNIHLSQAARKLTPYVLCTRRLRQNTNHMGQQNQQKHLPICPSHS